jgi:hypothetical protein
VSESSRANREKEELSQNMFDWEKGAGQRKLTAEEAERERVRQQNMDLSNALTGTTEGYMTNAKDSYRLADDAVAEFRKRFPNATEDQVNNVIKASKERVTQNPNAYIDPKEMTRQLQSTLMSEHGLGYEEAQKAAADQVGSYFTTPKGPNEEILKARLDIIKNGGISDGMSKFGISGNGGSGSAYSGSKGNDEFRKGAKFVTDNQLNNENNQWEKGSEGFWDNILPGRDQVFIDDAEAMALNAQTQNGVEAQYVIAALEGLSSDGKLPDGYSAKDMRNVKSDFYQDVVKKAGELQNYFKSGAGGGGGKETQLSLEQFRGIRQGDLNMKMQAVNQLEAALKSFGGGPLSSEDQYQLMSDPQLLEQAGIAMNQSLQQQGGGNNSAGNSTPAAAPVPTTAPVVENSGAEAGQSSSVAAEESDDPELTSLIEGADETAQSTNESSITFEQNMERIRNLSYEDVQKDLSGPGLEMALGLIDKLKSGEATAKEQQSLEGLLPVPAPKAEKREITIDNLTPGDIRESIPGGPNQTKSLNLLRMVNAGNASDRQVEELMAMLDIAKK